MVRVLFSLVACAAVVAASVVTPRYTVKESIKHTPNGWSPVNVAPPSHTFRLRIGLAQPNFSQLEAELYEVSDPAHPNYGNHLSKERVEELVKPHPDSLKHVHEWLDCHGVHKSKVAYSPAKDWVIAEVTIEQAEKLLDTKYHVYEHASSGRQLVRTTSYSLPEHMHEHVDTIQPTTFFNGIRAMRTTFHTEPAVEAPAPAAGLTINAAIDPSCNATITPACLQALYNTAGYTPKNDPKSSLGIAGYLDQYANDADLQLFYAKYLPTAVNQNYSIELVNGGVNPQDPSQAGVEANLDVQYGGALSSPIKNIYYSTPGSPPFNPSASTPSNTNEPYADFLDYLLAQKDLPQTLTTSYGDDEQTVPKSYATKVCNQFAQLGARGVSILFSSGDGGVGDGDGSANSTECVSNDGKSTKKFLPAFPAGCPYVTTVGGTHFVPEVAVGFSGGGFSTYFDRPLYQTLQVDAYILKYLGAGKVYKGLWNTKGRAYPDIAGQGSHFRVFVGGKEGGVGGTSASSPTVAGIIALLNDALIARGRKPLGFLNPWLYTIGQFALNDITAGNNPGCGTPGFNATKGWDPVTGLGTPDFKKLLVAVGIFDEKF